MCFVEIQLSYFYGAHQIQNLTRSAGSRLAAALQTRNAGLLSEVSEIMRAFAVPIDYYYCCYSSYPCLLLPPSFTNTKLSSFHPKFASLSSHATHRLPSQFRPTRLRCSNSGSSTFLDGDDDDGYCSYAGEEESGDSVREDGVFIEIKKLQKNSRRIRSKISINASLDTVWKILTDYEKLADFIPGLAVSKLIDKKDKFARLYQVNSIHSFLIFSFSIKLEVDTSFFLCLIIHQDIS